MGVGGRRAGHLSVRLCHNQRILFSMSYCKIKKESRDAGTTAREGDAMVPLLHPQLEAGVMAQESWSTGAGRNQSGLPGLSEQALPSTVSQGCSTCICFL